MPAPTPNYRYYAFGLVIESELPLPELVELTASDRPADLEIVRTQWDTIGNLPVQLEQSGTGHDYYATLGGTFYLHAAQAALFSVRQGTLITVSPLPGSCEDQIRLYLLGTCLGVVLLQRGLLPLHGSAVVIDGQAYAFVGESGAGKSTLAASFLQAGYSLLTDDVIAVSLDNPSGCPLVIPAYPQQKLWQDSLKLLHMDNDRYSPLFSRYEKYAVPAAGQFHNSAVPLKGIWELVPADEPELAIRSITGLTSFPLLYKHTYRQFLVSELGLMDWHFAVCTRLLEHTGVWRLQRPVASAHHAAETVEALLHLIRKEALSC